MPRLAAVFGLAALLAALGCGGNNTGSTSAGTSLSGGPAGIPRPSPPPPMPTLRQ